MDSLERSLLYVEGDDDLHAICHLLIQDYDQKPWPDRFPEVKTQAARSSFLLACTPALLE